MNPSWLPFDSSIEQHPKYPYIMYVSRQYNIDPMLGHYLFFHGYDNEEKVQKFFYPDLSRDLHDPFLLNDMKKAIIRIIKAIRQKEKILIFGDYDCDGMTSTSLLYLALKHFNGNVSYRLPLRSEGYGLSGQAMKQVKEGISLIITVDNGTSSHEAMKVAKEKGIDVIVTDHHEVLGPYPNCYAFINPKRHDTTYPFSSLSGAGVALKVVQALYFAANREFDDHFYSYIELATLGTIADLMPITDENRTICKLGIKKMNLNPNPVFKKVFEKSFVKQVDSSTIGFTLGPIFNSCGRIGNPNLAVNLLTNEDVNDSQIKSFIQLNEKRKALTTQQFTLAEKQISGFQLHKDKVIVVFDDFHNGIIGIIAAKITEKYKKPSIVISKNGTGSARSVNGTNFSIINVIRNSSQHLLKYGGHQAAAGLSIEPKEDTIISFRNSIQEASNSEVLMKPVIHYICKMDVHHFSNELYENVNFLEPYGVNIPKPLFYCHSRSIPTTSFFGSNNEHLKLYYRKKEAIAFYKGKDIKAYSKKTNIHALYTTFNTDLKNFIIHSLKTE
ncbi:single-stranded-DNA-specific exonuclease RecJ [Bacillus sp. FJAT-49736]|uniref:single-stranded-DNA-specific exonuclease RecJ n=1 Tax=Bacillus sp. FJAT-49736 TaxID=2833582 RepID=UPI001BCA02D9|nr:single-stranded-DNA-specific exonuclease RecJ [Bacillus sp. FJAT-49736]MBS4171813.1 single-stranded-DNA-specific exonuclease RecJ [Bacillus sp. FJAT-49736]